MSPQRLHTVCPIPAIKMGIIKLVCTDDIEVKEEVITPLPDDYPSPSNRYPGRKGGIPSPALWDVGSVVELSPDVTKITLSISELRDKIKCVSDQKEWPVLQDMKVNDMSLIIKNDQDHGSWFNRFYLKIKSDEMVFVC